MRRLFAVLLLSVLLPRTASAVDFLKSGELAGAINVGSSTAGTRVCTAIDNSCYVQVISTAAVPICFAQVAAGAAGVDNCATAFTDPDNAAFCLDAKGAYLFSAREDGWIGPICAMRETGSGNIKVRHRQW